MRILTPVEYQNETMSNFTDYLEDEVPFLLIDDLGK